MYKVFSSFKKSLITFSALIFVDQLSKYIIRTSGGFYICNKNIAFGIQIPDFLFWIFWLLIIGLLLIALYKKYFIHNTLYIILILAGAISNIIDRIYLGCIVDFIDLKFWPASIAMRSIAGWPVFNLADIFITLGAVLIIAKLIKSTDHKQSS